MPGPMHRMPQPIHPLLVQKKEEPEIPFIPPDLEDLESPEEEEYERGVKEDREEVSEDEESERVVPPQDIPRAPSTIHVHPQLPRQELIPLKVYKFHPSKDDWKHATLSGTRPTDGRPKQMPRPRPPCSQLRIITWNVDFNTPRAEDRLFMALRHIEEEVLGCKAGEAPEPCAILLQEVHMKVLPFLLQDPWVRRWFAVTPFTREKWPRETTYGNVTLVARSVDIYDAHILHYGYTTMHRTALCVKVRLNFPGSQERAVLSIVNTHLESLPMGSSARPKQLELSSRFLRLKGVDGGVIAGDMNAIAPGDATIGKDLGLRDSWRKGDDDRGKTWGFQGQNGGGQYPPNRLDKIYYLPGRGYKVEEPRRIGIDLKVGEGRDALWVSDHYGLCTILRMKGRSQSS